VTELIRSNKPLQRKDMMENTEDQDKRFKSIVTKFLKLDLEHADLQAFLSELQQTSSAD